MIGSRYNTSDTVLIEESHEKNGRMVVILKDLRKRKGQARAGRYADAAGTKYELSSYLDMPFRLSQ